MEEASREALPAFCRARTLILGCGNVLFGDDGFGSAVIDYLEQHFEIPADVYLLDAGTGVRTLLFTVSLSSVRPERILIVDAVDRGRTPGEVFDLDPMELPATKQDDFSFHQLPTSNLLRELADEGSIEVRVLCCQTGPLPEEISPGLSDPVRRAVAVAAELIATRYLVTAADSIGGG
ncbi:MAG: hydrogenase maturation protease [Thermoanaerobaculales bacterium]